MQSGQCCGIVSNQPAATIRVFTTVPPRRSLRKSPLNGTLPTQIGVLTALTSL